MIVNQAISLLSFNPQIGLRSDCIELDFKEISYLVYLLLYEFCLDFWGMGVSIKSYDDYLCML